MDLNSYLERKAALQSLMEKVSKISVDFQLKNVEINLQNNIKSLSEENFNLVVVGEFSRGKSTFINAILGKKILPSSKQPTTNIINRIIYGDIPNYKLFYKNGDVEEIQEDQFVNIKAQSEKNLAKKALSTLKGKISGDDFSVNPQEVNYAEIAYPVRFCQNNVVVIDTPGTNDLNVGRMEITYNYLKKAEAAILVLSATQPLTASEKAFLKEQVLGNSIKDIFIVVNYKDALNENDEKAVIKHILDHLNEFADFSKRIFLVSSKQALTYRRDKDGEKLSARQKMELPNSLEETGFTSFEEALGYFLEEEKGNAKLHKYIEVTNNCLDDIGNSLQAKLEASDHSTDELTKQLQEQRPKFERIKRETGHIVESMKVQLENERMGLEDMVLDMEKKIRANLNQVVSRYEKSMTSEEFNYQLESAITPIQKEFIEQINDFEDEVTKNASKKALMKLRKIWNDMECEAEYFPIKTVTFSSVDISGIHANTESDDAVGNGILTGLLGTALFDGGIGLMLGLGAYLLSGGGVSNYISAESQVKNKVNSAYSEGLKQLRKEIDGQYDKSIRYLCTSMQQEIESKLDEMDQQLTLLIEEKQRKDYDAEAEKKKIEKQIQEVYGLREKLSEVL